MGGGGGGGKNFFLKGGGKIEGGGGGGGGGVVAFLLLTVQFNHIYSLCVCVCGGSEVRFPLYLLNLQSFELAMEDSQPSL